LQAAKEKVPMSSLAGRRILVLEDEYFLADDLAEALRSAGAEVIGPAAGADEAMAMIAAAAPDLAVLDINIKGEMSFVVADELARRGLPFVFATGYDPRSIPERHAGRLLWQKPFDIAELVGRLSG
jgi:DNA-binding response OmpR family regulator